MISKRHPIKILHVVGGMNPGGTETWLMHVLRDLDQTRFQMDFLVHTREPCAYDEEIRALGSQIIPCLNPSEPWTYAFNFKRLLGEHGPYDIVHSHVHHFSGYVLCLAKQAGVPIRIAHSHNDTTSAKAKAGWQRRFYLALMESWLNRYATLGLAASSKAAAALFGSIWKVDPHWQINYCGIDLTPFQEIVSQSAVRDELGIPSDAFVIGHVGRFQEQKNHAFLLDIFAKVAQQEPRTYLLLVGDGPLKQDIMQQAVQVGLAEQVIFTGLRYDIPRLMMGAMNVFVLPSFFEGLPLVGMEAQAAGLPFILSDVITEELDVVKPLMQRLSLSEPACDWAAAVLAARETSSNMKQPKALNIMRRSPFNIQNSLRELEKVYLESS